MTSQAADQVERVEFRRGMTQKMSEIGEALRVLEPKGTILPADGPVLAVLAEDPLRDAWRGGHHLCLRRSGTWSLHCETTGLPPLSAPQRARLGFTAPSDIPLA